MNSYNACAQIRRDAIVGGPQPDGSYIIDDSELYSKRISAACTFCKHWNPGTRSCAAFAVIPDSIWEGKDGHTSFVMGDGGVKFEPIEGAPLTEIEAYYGQANPLPRTDAKRPGRQRLKSTAKGKRCGKGFIASNLRCSPMEPSPSAKSKAPVSGGSTQKSLPTPPKREMGKRAEVDKEGVPYYSPSTPAEKALYSIETSIRNDQRKENAAAYDPVTGEVFGPIEGKSSSVTIPQEWKGRGLVFTHNHPNLSVAEKAGIKKDIEAGTPISLHLYSGAGGSFSKADIEVIHGCGLSEMRAVDKTYVYSAKPLPSTTERWAQMSREQVRGEIDAAELTAGYEAAAELMGKVRKGEMSLSAAGRDFSHLGMEKLAAKIGLDYSRKIYQDAPPEREPLPWALAVPTEVWEEREKRKALESEEREKEKEEFRRMEIEHREKRLREEEAAKEGRDQGSKPFRDFVSGGPTGDPLHGLVSKEFDPESSSQKSISGILEMQPDPEFGEFDVDRATRETFMGAVASQYLSAKALKLEDSYLIDLLSRKPSHPDNRKWKRLVYGALDKMAAANIIPDLDKFDRYMTDSIWVPEPSLSTLRACAQIRMDAGKGKKCPGGYSIPRNHKCGGKKKTSVPKTPKQLRTSGEESQPVKKKTNKTLPLAIGAVAALSAVGVGGYLTYLAAKNQISEDPKEYKWPDKMTDQEIREHHDSFVPGDLLKQAFYDPDTGIYMAHWAVYAGKDPDTGQHMVIENEEGGVGRGTNEGGIGIHDIREEDAKYTPDVSLFQKEEVPPPSPAEVKAGAPVSREEILMRANAMVGQPHNFHVYSNNCETIARAIVQGKEFASTQASRNIIGRIVVQWMGDRNDKPSWTPEGMSGSQMVDKLNRYTRMARGDSLSLDPGESISDSLNRLLSTSIGFKGTVGKEVKISLLTDWLMSVGDRLGIRSLTPLRRGDSMDVFNACTRIRMDAGKGKKCPGGYSIPRNHKCGGKKKLSSPETSSEPENDTKRRQGKKKISDPGEPPAEKSKQAPQSKVGMSLAGRVGAVAIGATALGAASYMNSKLGYKKRGEVEAQVDSVESDFLARGTGEKFDREGIRQLITNKSRDFQDALLDLDVASSPPPPPGDPGWELINSMAEKLGVRTGSSQLDLISAAAERFEKKGGSKIAYLQVTQASVSDWQNEYERHKDWWGEDNQDLLEATKEGLEYSLARENALIRAFRPGRPRGESNRKDSLFFDEYYTLCL